MLMAMAYQRKKRPKSQKNLTYRYYLGLTACNHSVRMSNNDNFFSRRERLSQKWEQMKKKLAGWYSLIFLFFSIFNIFTLMFCMAIIHNPSGCSLKSPGPDDQLQNPLMIPCIWEPSEVFPTNTPYFVGLVTIIANLILYLLVIFSSGFYCCHESCHYRWTHIHEQCKIRYFLAICYFMMLLFVGTGYVLGRVGRIVTGGEFMEKPFHESVHYKIVYPNPYSHSVSDGYMSSDEIDEKLVSVLDKIQLVYQCCGVDNYTDYRPYDRWHTRHVPDSCCITISPGCANNQTNIHEKGCFPAIKEQFQIAMKAYNYNRVATIYFFFLLFLALFVLLIKYAVYLGNRQALLQKLIELPEEHKNATGIEEINDDDRENDEASNVDTEKACTVNIDIENNIDDDNEDNALLNGVHSNLENEMSEGSDIDLLIEGELDINAIEEIIGGETQVKVPIDTSFINPAYQEGHNGSTASMAIANVEPPIQMQFIT